MTSRRTLAAGLGGFVLASAAQAQTTETESTFERIRRTKVIRAAALPGEAPFFFKDIATSEWSGTAVEMAKDIARVWDAKLEFVETTYPGSVLDLQANKVDMAFALQPTPQRALAIGFSRTYYMHPFAYVSRKDFTAVTWKDLDKPEIRVAALQGALSDVFMARFAPKAQTTNHKSGAEAVLALQSGRADCVIYGVVQALGVTTKNPTLGKVTVLQDPLIALPSCIGVRQEPDKRWREFLDNWVDYNRGTRQIREWFIQGLAKGGVDPSAIPADSGF
jgi:polar amino acid transport system substrate-binding protein